MKPTLEDLEKSTPENWEKLFRKAYQHHLVQLTVTESKGPVMTRARVELDRRKLNLDRFAIIISVLSFLVSIIAVIVAIYHH